MKDRPVLRVIDTGLRHPRAHMAFDAALLDMHRQGAVPDTLRFMQFPPSVLVGRHQSLAREVDLDYCARHAIAAARRLTGGGAIYMDQGQIGWELVLQQDRVAGLSLDAIAARICNAVAAALRTLGLAAAFRPRNDIEVGGRKIAGTGGFLDGGTLLYQGTVILSLDPARMAGALRAAAAKLARHGAAAMAARVTSAEAELGRAPDAAEMRAALARELPEALGLDPVAAAPDAAEEALAARHLAGEIGSDAFVDSIAPPRGPDVLSATVETAGGTMSAHLRLQGGIVREALLKGDVFVTPPRVMADLEAALRGVAADRAVECARAFLAAARIDAMSLPRDAIPALLGQALANRQGAGDTTEP